MTSAPADGGGPATVTEVLARGRIEVTGRLGGASNVTLLTQVALAGESLHAVYKPVSGERPLWDFPDGSLAAREVAAYVLAEAAGSACVPVTILRREAPFGPGSLQQWVGPAPDSDAEPGDGLVDLFAPRELPPGWRAVFAAEDRAGRDVLLAHADTPDLREIALLDVVLNNADRKGGHVIATDDGVRGIDHGLTFHRQPKLRTVLWGWAGERLSEQDEDLLRRLAEAFEGPACDRLAELVRRAELAAARDRLEALRTAGALPEPEPGWPPIPWPPF